MIRRALAAWRARTEPRADALARVRARLDADPDAAPDAAPLSRALLSTLPEPHPAHVARVRARLDAPAPRRRVAAPLAGLALAAALAALWLRPVALDAPLAEGTHTLGPLVTVVADGHGAAGGTARAPRVTWEAGTLHVDVVPDAGVDLEVTTPEARVRVVGTVFSVTRDRLGTAVSVARGKVEVTCADAAPLLLPAGSAHTCMPTRPAGLLGRAQALLEDARADDARDAAERGLALAPAGPVHDELAVTRLEALLHAGRLGAVVATAEALLAEGTSRAPEVRRLAAAAARVSDGCDGLRRWLVDTRDAGDLVALADCEPDPARARGLLEEAARRATVPRHAEAIRVRLDNLPPGDSP